MAECSYIFIYLAQVPLGPLGYALGVGVKRSRGEGGGKERRGVGRKRRPPRVYPPNLGGEAVKRGEPDAMPYDACHTTTIIKGLRALTSKDA